MTDFSVYLLTCCITDRPMWSFSLDFTRRWLTLFMLIVNRFCLLFVFYILLKYFTQGTWKRRLSMSYTCPLEWLDKPKPIICKVHGWYKRPQSHKIWVSGHNVLLPLPKNRSYVWIAVTVNQKTMSECAWTMSECAWTVMHVTSYSTVKYTLFHGNLQGKGA